MACLASIFCMIVMHLCKTLVIFDDGRRYIEPCLVNPRHSMQTADFYCISYITCSSGAAI